MSLRKKDEEMREDSKHLIPKETALRLVWDYWHPIQTKEMVSILDAFGRVLAEDQYSKVNLPVFRASTMDGIAVHSERFADGIPEETENWKLGVDYVRADTGDDFADGFDAVIAIENVEILEHGGIKFISENVNVSKGFNIKPCGADVREGTLLVKAGTVLQAQDVAAIAMGGIGEVSVVKKPKVAFLPTGSELIPVGGMLKRGQNFDTNSLLIGRMLQEMGAEAILHSIVKDDPALVREALEKLLLQADIILVGAGTSKGGEDYSVHVLEERGNMLFHGVAAVPGRPMSVTMIEGKPVVNLAGPSVAAFHGMDWLVKALVSRALGVAVPVRERVTATLTERFQFPSHHSVMENMKIVQKEDGTYFATPVIRRGPKADGTVAALTANGVYITKIGEQPHEAGSSIEVELLRNRAYVK